MKILAMLEKNSLPIGILVGVLIPVIGYLIISGLYEGLEILGWVSDSGFRPKFRERTIGIIALAMNAIALNYYQKRYFTNTVRGIVIVTAFWVGLWLYLYGEYVL